MSDAKIRAIVKRPDEKYGHVTNISNTPRNFQRTVGGPFEVVPVGGSCVVICNEEGKIRGLEPNFYMGPEPFVDLIVGDVAVLGVDGEDFCDCPISFTVWKKLLEEWGN